MHLLPETVTFLSLSMRSLMRGLGHCGGLQEAEADEFRIEQGSHNSESPAVEKEQSKVVLACHAQTRIYRCYP